ncbi:hypothetical protein K490DRAFT_13538, partial [Saccharata proteae CBS 121410]
MGPEQPLPLPEEFSDADAYVDSLLHFGTSSELLRTLCGGVHILDFFTREPALYPLVIPEPWRIWFKYQDIMDILDLFMRRDLSRYAQRGGEGEERREEEEQGNVNVSVAEVDGGPAPPESLIQFIRDIRKHSLRREFHPPPKQKGAKSTKLARHVALGMKVKKIHEVENFARYVDQLTADIEAEKGRTVTHVADFGSGQNYLGRALASPPYNKHIIAIEGRPHNIVGAKEMDVLAGLAPKKKKLVNKKEYREKTDWRAKKKAAAARDAVDETRKWSTAAPETKATLQTSVQGQGSIQYVEYRMEDGNLAPVSEQTVSSTTKATDPNLIVISIHSCGNLSHHGIRSLTLNPTVKAIAMVGCCYNLVTERLGPPSYKLPTLRPNHPRLETTANAFDPHGFPMSNRMATYPVPSTNDTGVRLNITARMMAVQAPQNWGPDDSAAFFTRHFYRALLQRIFFDRGIVGQPKGADDVVGGRRNEYFGGVSPAGCSSGSAPIVIGSLKKSCYHSFTAYVRGATSKILSTPETAEQGEGWNAFFADRMAGLTDREIEDYAARFGEERKKELSVVWALMAFSAGVVEAMIVVDRWLWLREQEEVDKAWVEAVFDYGLSPRNLVVVGIKK